MIVRSIDQLIGKTPVIHLTTLSQELKRNIYLKLEFLNPGGSVKDRIALSMIDDAMQKGLLKPGDTLIEPTSGNTGIGLALVAAARNIHCVIVMPETVSIERQKIVQGYGAELVLTSGELGIQGSINKALELKEKYGYFMPMQFDNPANPKAHEKHTALEIIEDFDHLDAFVAAVGTGGTITGSGKVLKTHYPHIKIVAVEPFDSAVLSGNPPQKHKIMGIGPGFIPRILNTDIYQTIIKVQNNEAFETARWLAKNYGIFGGISTGANLFAAIEYSKELPENSRVLTIACSNAERYLSTELFN
jgi:cysteine synthase A